MSENCADFPSVLYSDQPVLSDEFWALNTEKSIKTAILSESNANAAFYANENDDIMQILSRAEIGIEHILNENLKGQLKSKLLGPSNMSSYDCTALLQMIAFIELDFGLSAQNSNADKLPVDSHLKSSARVGPLTENHLQVLRLLCKPDLFLEPAAAKNGMDKQEKHPNSDTDEKDREPAQHSKNALRNDVEVQETDNEQDSKLAVLKIVELLQKLELQPSYLLHQECREVLEANLINRQSQGPLSSEQLAILQLLSKAEIDSETVTDLERRKLLQKRMWQGPLSLSHLGAVADLAKYDHEELLQEKALLAAEPPADSKNNSGEIASTAVEHSEAAAAQGEPTLANLTRSKTTFYDQTIAGLEICSDRSALLSKEEKARMQLLELKIKTDRIRQSIPEWVRRGLLPPRKELETKPRKPAQASDSPVLISSFVRADLIYPFSASPIVTFPPKRRNLLHADEDLFGRRPGYAPGLSASGPGPTESGLAEVVTPVAPQATVLAVQFEPAERLETKTDAETRSKVSQLWQYLCRSFWWFIVRCCAWSGWSSS